MKILKCLLMGLLIGLIKYFLNKLLLIISIGVLLMCLIKYF